ncbi:MAG: MaoC family dehydratase N-terminal domain-containing protein [Alphaproteobacteria bacterium]|nr:MaoC family dehydratase N-terminal domain-containing protein [Alphaproteobacteria bacterium]
MAEKTLDPAVLSGWVGKTERHEDVIAVQSARFLEMTFDREPTLGDGDPLPALWHWIYFLKTAPMSQLGRDGHPAVGGFLPPVALPRRMWAGGRLTFTRPLRLGETADKMSMIKNVTVKQGRSGTLCFVTVEHVFSVAGETRFTEEHDIVYREDPSPDAPKPQPAAPPEGATVTRTITPSEVLLFRYSALTFNGHRIHYDLDYCREVEGYPGLVFHGPLTATLLAGLAVAEAGRPLKSFSFRAVSPLFHTAAFEIRAKDEETGIRVWAETPEGHLAMTAEAEPI